MARYLSEEDAAADGITIVHESERSRFAVYRERESVGEAHYTLGEIGGEPAIDFDHTFVDPQWRGTGLSGLLAHRAVTDNISDGRRKLASCWFIAGYLQRNPELQ